MATPPIPLEVLRGLYLGILTGVLPALLAFGFGFLFRYVTGVSIPAFAVIVLGLALAGVNGGLLAFVDPSITESANSIALMTAVVVVLMLSLYTHSLGDRLATTIPRHFSLETIRATTISTDVVDFVGGRGEVQVSVVGEVRDMEGYPPLPEPLRAALGAVEWRFPADLPIEELEARMGERYRTEFDLQAVEVTMDARGRATVSAAPPRSGVSRRLEAGWRAVSFDALVPSGVARGEAVTVLTEDGAVEGTVVSARSGEVAAEAPVEQDADPAAEGTDGAAHIEATADEQAPSTPVPETRAPTTTGGRGRVTVAVRPGEARDLLDATDARVVVTSRGSRREFELVSLLHRAGQRLRRVTLRSGGAFDGTTLGELAPREQFGVAILAIRSDTGWLVAPRGDATLQDGTEVYVVGTHDRVEQFREAVA
ncbi:MAG: potassium channel family protein [Halobacteriota archaeon]